MGGWVELEGWPGGSDCAADEAGHAHETRRRFAWHAAALTALYTLWS